MNVGDAGQKGSSEMSGCESAGVGSVDSDDVVEAVEVDCARAIGGPGYTEWLVLLERDTRDSTDADGCESCGESIPKLPKSDSVVGDMKPCLPSDPDRLRDEMKLNNRSRFRGFTGEGEMLGLGTTTGRPASGLTESIDHREAVGVSSSKVTGGRRTELLANGDDIDGTSEMREGLCATERGDDTLIGEAGILANSARARSCGDEVEVARFRLGRIRFFRLASDAFGTWKASTLPRRRGCT